MTYLLPAGRTRLGLVLPWPLSTSEYSAKREVCSRPVFDLASYPSLPLSVMLASSPTEIKENYLFIWEAGKVGVAKRLRAELRLYR